MHSPRTAAFRLLQRPLSERVDILQRVGLSRTPPCLRTLRPFCSPTSFGRTRSASGRTEELDRFSVSVGAFSPRRFRTARRLDSDQLFPQSAFALNLRGKRSPDSECRFGSVSGGFFPRRFRTARRLDSGQRFPQSALALNLRGSHDFRFSNVPNPLRPAWRRRTLANPTTVPTSAERR